MFPNFLTALIEEEWRKPRNLGSNYFSPKSPPFLSQDDMFELLVDVDPCQEYYFNLDFQGPLGSLGDIQDLHLPKLADMLDFHPPKLSKMFKIETTPSLSLKLAPGFEIPDNLISTCIKDFIAAVDKHMHVLEEDVRFHIQEEKITHRAIYDSEMKYQELLSVPLEVLGCSCTSRKIEISGTRSGDDSNVSHLKKFMGMYKLAGYYEVSMNEYVIL